jgi:hypothetical protein
MTHGTLSLKDIGATSLSKSDRWNREKQAYAYECSALETTHSCLLSFTMQVADQGLTLPRLTQIL